MSIDNPNHLEESKVINKSPNQEMCLDYYKQFLDWRGSLSKDELNEHINMFIDKLNSIGFEIDKVAFERFLTKESLM